MDSRPLRLLLDELAPFDDREATYRDRLIALLDTTSEPFSRTQFRPGHVTAGGFVLAPDRSALLLVKHRKLGMWLQPGGHVEPFDESVIDTQRREIEEETLLSGLDWLGVFDLDVHTFPRRDRDPEHEHFDVRSAFVSPTWAVAPGDGTDDVRWFPFEEIPRGDASIARPVAKLMAGFGR